MSKIRKILNIAKTKDKYLSKDELITISSLKKAIKETTVIVTCMGLYNHGKSSLLNSLIKDFDYKTFKVADTRETSQNKEVVTDDITFVDTPGLNAKDYDDKRVMDAVKQSDINLFVHNVTTGEFAKKEIEFLQNIKKHWKNPKEFIDRTIFVLSRIDASNENDIKSTQEKMKEQIKDIFGCESLFVCVSSKNYIKGMKEEKKLLIAKSNIDVLNASIRNIKDSIKDEILKTKQDRLCNLYDGFINRLDGKVQTNLLEISQLNKAKMKVDKAFNSDINNIKSTLSNMYAKLERV